jgi:hypothetical protein
MGALDMALVATRYSTTLAPRRYLAEHLEIRDPTEDGTEARARFWIVRAIASAHGVIFQIQLFKPLVSYRSITL